MFHKNNCIHTSNSQSRSHWLAKLQSTSAWLYLKELKVKAITYSLEKRAYADNWFEVECLKKSEFENKDTTISWLCLQSWSRFTTSLSLSWQYHLNPEPKKIKQPHDNYIQPSNSVCLTLISRVAINLKEFLNDQIKVETLKHWEFRNGVFNNLSAMIANLSLKWQFHLTQDIINSRSYNNIIFNPATHFSSDGIAECNQPHDIYEWLIIILKFGIPKMRTQHSLRYGCKISE